MTSSRAVANADLTRCATVSSWSAGAWAVTWWACPLPSAVATDVPWSVPLRASWSPCWSTMPNAAMPRAWPSWRKVFIAPLAMPPRSGGTAAMAVAAITGETTPTPSPVSTRPGIRSVQLEPASSIVCSRLPTLISARPPLRASQLGSRGRCLPASAETTKAIALIGSTTRPPETGLSSSTDCTHSEVYGR